MISDARAPALTPIADRAAVRRGPLTIFARRLGRDRAATVSLLVVATILILAVAAPILPLADPLEQDLVARLIPPVWSADGSVDHLLGTDQLGRDILSRVIWGARISLLVGLSAVAISGLLGVTAGVLAGYLGGRVDNVLMRIADGQLAIPFILLVIAVISVVGPGIQKVILVLGVTGCGDVRTGRAIRGAHDPRTRVRAGGARAGSLDAAHPAATHYAEHPRLGRRRGIG